MFRTIVLLSLLAISLPAQTADWLIKAHYVVTVDGSHRVIENGAIAIQGDHLVAVGTAQELARVKAKQTMDAGDAIIMPGLINTHTHVPMSLMRGIADDRKLQDWLEHYIFPAEAKNVSPEFVRWGTALGCAEMALGGTTTFTDMYYFEELIAETTKKAGLRGVLGESVIGFPVADAKTPQDALVRAEAFIKKYKGDALIVPAVAPHAVYTNSDETLKAARALANKYQVPMLIHLSETKKENDDTLAQRHMTPTQLLDSLGALEGRTVGAHGVWVTPDDMAILAKRNVGIAHCPSSNMKLASGVAPVLDLMSRGVNVGLGPDGPAGSNNDFSLFEEMNLAANLQKVTKMDPQVLNARTAIDMATINGARVLGMEKEIGSLETGKKADFIVISLEAPHAMPLYDVESQIVYALKSSDVRDVMINGQWIVRSRKMLTLDMAQIKAKTAEFQKKVAASVAR